MKKKFNWRPVAVVTALAVILGVGVWYVNGVYIPNHKAALADELLGENNAQIGQNTQQPGESNYDYTIDPNEQITVDVGEVLGNESNVTVSTDENGDVWIDRDWVVDTTDYDKSGAEPGEEEAAGNMTSGTITEDILGEDGVYYGEEEENTEPVEEPVEEPVDEPEPDPSPESTDEPDEPDPTPSPSSGSSSPSITTITVQNKDGERVEVTGQWPENPKNGDECVVNDAEYMYLEWVGWMEIIGPNQQIPLDNELTGVTCPNANFG